MPEISCPTKFFIFKLMVHYMHRQFIHKEDIENLQKSIEKNASLKKQNNINFMGDFCIM